jgi:hypothetical protein
VDSNGLFTAEALNAFERAIKATEPVRYAEDSAARMTERAEICPYRGLQIFREEDVAFFVGRKAFAEQLFDFTLGKNLSSRRWILRQRQVSRGSGRTAPLAAARAAACEHMGRRQLHTRQRPVSTVGLCSDSLLEPELSETARLAEAEELGRA